MVVHWQSVECRFEEIGLKSSLCSRGKIIKGVGRLEVCREGIEAHEGSILDELCHISSSEVLLLLLLLLKGPIRQGVHTLLKR
jgi:hypothetical protein